MSSYQYYEFRAIDRPLDKAEMAALRRVSPGSELSARQLAMTYTYSDFGADPVKLMQKYFDAMVYVSSFGWRTVMFRLPSKLFDAAAAMGPEAEAGDEEQVREQAEGPPEARSRKALRSLRQKPTRTP